MTLREERIRVARVIHGVAVATVPMYALVAELAGPTEPGDFAIFRLVFFVLSATMVLIGFQVRARMIPAAEDALRRAPNDPYAWQPWTSGHLISWVTAETVVLFGMVLRFVGGTLLESLPFYIVGLGMLLAWAPRRPE